MAGGSKAKGRKGKIGRHKASIAAYYNGGQYLFNKARRMVKHIRRCDDNKTWEALKLVLVAMPQGKAKMFRALYGEYL